ncbi:hypothetical protein ILUMI_06260 [Ignelater luminosus]|uniref:Junctophilin n=1 Tax=Ignelater luminosus TaxID=2038154 RepID=A0A8K0D9K6_IGNLU|nr:hypothetical protein ILUMI_06260 [Ignelater luminosus]
MQQANQVNSSSGGEGVVTSPAATGATGTATTKSHVNGGRFDFDDGGTYCGGWEDGKAHGHGVCTGPKGQGAYSGSWHYGFEVSGVYTWPSGSAFEGQWQNGKRHGLGVETRGRWIYRGEWTQGFKGRYGVRQSNTSTAKYEGTWANGLQDGYGSETYADDGTYQGQWLRGMRHGYGVRNSAPFGKASKYRNKALRASLTSLRSNEGGNTSDAAEKRDRRVDDSRGGFVLKMNSDEPARRRSLGEKSIKRNFFTGLKIKKPRSTGDLEKGTGSIRSTGSSASWVSADSAQSAMTNASLHTDSNASFVVEDEHMDANVTETYMGEWKNDKRSGFGISERSDGLKYEGEWYANKKYGYGVTTFSNGEKEEGKYKNNVLITSNKKKHLFLMRSAKFRERIDAAVNAAQRASKIALQKADIAISRTATARGKAEQADIAAAHAREDSDIAQAVAKQYAPDFKQPGLERLRKYRDKFADSIYNSQKDASLTSSSIPNQIPNQLPHQINSQLPNKVPNQIPEMKNQLPIQPPTIQLTKETTISTHNPSIYHNQTDNYPQTNKPSSSSYYQQQQKMPSPADMYGASINTNSVDATTIKQVNEKELRVTRNSLPRDEAPQPSALRRMSRRVSGERPPNIGWATQQSEERPQNTRASQQAPERPPNIGWVAQQSQSSIDYFDHYKRPPSRDSSVDRYSRATGRLSAGGSRQPSVDMSAGPSDTPDRMSRAPSAVRGSTPVPMPAKNGSIQTGNSLKIGNSIMKPSNPMPQPPPFEDIIRKRGGLGQDIIPSLNQPKRTESLYINPGATAAPVAKHLVEPTTLQRKKSLPDVQVLPKATEAMSREEVSALGSARREEVRRMADEKERLRANPLLYLVSPQVKDWFSRQQLVIIVLFVNISLAIMFFKLLT